MPECRGIHIVENLSGEEGDASDPKRSFFNSIDPQRSWKACDEDEGFSYFVTMRRGGDGVGAGGEIVNETQVFQPWARFSAANSL